MKVLITGKNGDISTAISEWLKEEHGFETEQISLRGEKWKENDLSAFDAVVHVAGIVPKDGVTAEDFYNINYELTKCFANKAKNEGIKHFVYISSMAVYGAEAQISCEKGTVKSDTPCKPISDYGKSKLLAEQSLKLIEDDNFKLTIIRAPSIYGKGKTEYLDQYKHITEKFKFIPKAFIKNYKSIIYVENLCELIYLVIENETTGVICPDDGQISAFDICKAVRPDKKNSKLLGLIFNLFKNSDRIRDYYGSLCYSENLTNKFDCKYRVLDFKQAVSKSYER